MSNTLTVGVTGGIGSGKSTVCHIFRILKVPVFDADTVAKNLLLENEEIRHGIINLFGNDVYLPDGSVNRKLIAQIIFNDEVQLKKMNQLVHPVVRDEFFKWKVQQKAPYVIHEAAILFESGFFKLMDLVLLITAPEHMQIERVMKRDGITEAQVKERMKRQMPNNKKEQLADLVLVNDNKNLLLPEIIEIDKKIKTYGKIW